MRKIIYYILAIAASSIIACQDPAPGGPVEMKIFFNDLTSSSGCWPPTDFDLFIDVYTIDPTTGNQKLYKQWTKDENSVSTLGSTLVLSGVPLTDGVKYIMVYKMESNICNGCCPLCTNPSPGGKQRWAKTTDPFVAHANGQIDGDLFPTACKCC